ncbi:F-actin-uncapping protein LRRC16A [Nymphon striatum]|nr:F-actin-uncapping protein LRRC16A [Nymphon striatum]
MSTRSVMTKDLSSSVRDVIGKHVKISLKVMVKTEAKGDKSSRVLAFSPYRMFVMSTKIPTKIEYSCNYLEIQVIESKSKNQLSITIDNRKFTFLTLDQESNEIDQIISHVIISIKTIFPKVPLTHIIRKIEVDDPNRLQKMYEHIAILESKDTGPCGGYSSQYACMCDFHGLPYREEVAWDVDTIYLSHDTKELSLQDFDHLDGKDLVPIISALIYNSWFTKLRTSNTKLVSEAAEQLINVMRKSVSIEEIFLDNIGSKGDFAHKLALALLQNSATPIHTIDLSYNLIEDKGAGYLSTPITKLQKGLIHLNLAHTGLTSKGVNALSQSLSLNKFMPSTLTYLNLSGNVFKEEVNNLYNFLAQPNSLTTINLSGTECSLETVFGALLRGCCQKLSHLNLSKNQFSSGKKSKDVSVPPSFKQFFSSTIALKYLNLSHNKLPNEALKSLLLGLASNDVAAEVELDMSSNDLKASGAVVLESCVSSIRCLTSLDISDNSFDTDLANVVSAISKNKSLKRLMLGRNFSTIKSKHIGYVLDSVVQMIQEEDSVLEHLSLADSKLKSETCLVINALGSNQCLHTIDVSGNNMGDAGAKTLAKALQINTKLRTVLWDRNNITSQGFQDVAYALDKNYTLRFMPFPIHDCALALKTQPERTDSALQKIEQCLHRNVSPKKYSNSQAFRLQQGFLLSSTHQVLVQFYKLNMVDRMMAQLNDTISKVKINPQDEVLDCEKVDIAENNIKDAEGSKMLLSKLHDVVVGREVGNPIEAKLQSLSEELASVIDLHIKGTVGCMVKCAENLCPGILNNEVVEHFADDMKISCEDRMQVPETFIHKCLVDQAGADVLNKVSEINLSVAAHISDRITDEVLDSLSRSYKSLVEKGSKQGSTTPDVLRNRHKKDDDSSKTTLRADSISEASGSPLATPRFTSKRKSVHTRKLRPQSVVESSDQMGSLPSITSSTSSQRLEHLGKARPKRTKTHAPSRPSVLTTSEMIEHIQEIDEGLDTFFKRRSTISSTPDSLSSLSPCEESVSETSSYHSNKEISKTNVDKNGVKFFESKIKSTDCQYTLKVSKTMSNGSSLGDGSWYDRNEAGCPYTLKVSKTMSNGSSLGDGSWSSKLFSQMDTTNKSPRTSFVKADANRDKADETENVIKRPTGLGKVGLNLASGGIGMLADLRSVTEKRLSLSPVSNKSDESPDKEKLGIGSGLLGVKLRSTGRAECLKSPTSGFQKPVDVEKSSKLNFTKKEDPASSKNIGSSGSGSGKQASDMVKSFESSSSPSSSRNQPSPALKPKPAPPIAPKPRPKSMLDGQNPDELAEKVASSPAIKHDTSTEGSEDGPGNRQSVRSMAAHLEKEKDAKKKSSSLPRNSQVPDSPGHFLSKDSGAPRIRSMYSPKEGGILADLIGKDSSSSAPSSATSASSNLSGLSGSHEGSVDEKLLSEASASHSVKLLVKDKNENVKSQQSKELCCDDIVNV